MLHVDFNWGCPKCNKMNREISADEDKYYTCRGCQNKFYLTFSVDVEDIEHYDEVNDHVYSVILVEIGRSQDKGKTWERIEVDTKDLNPDTSPLKDGDWIEYNGQIWEVSLNVNQNRLQTAKLTA